MQDPPPGPSRPTPKSHPPRGWVRDRLMYGYARGLLCCGGAGERSLGACGAGIWREVALAGRSPFRHAEACRGGGIGGAGRRDPARDKPVSRRPQKSAILLSVAARAEDTAGCPSGQRERSVKPSAQPTQVRTLHLPHAVSAAQRPSGASSAFQGCAARCRSERPFVAGHAIYAQ